jgi:hypothetical protein
MKAIDKRNLIILKARELGLDELAQQFEQVGIESNTMAPEAKESIMFEDMYYIIKDEPFNEDINKIWGTL